MFERLRPLLRVEPVLVAFILVAAGASVYFFRERGTADEQLTKLETLAVAVESNLEPRREQKAVRKKDLESEQAAMALKQEQASSSELEMIRRSFASKQDARDLMTRIISRADESGPTLGDIRRSQGVRSVAEIEFPSVSYSLVATGPPAEFIGVLDIVWGVPTASVETLQLSRDPKDPERWVMELDLLVVYAENGSQGVPQP